MEVSLMNKKKKKTKQSQSTPHSQKFEAWVAHFINIFALS